MHSQPDSGLLSMSPRLPERNTARSAQHRGHIEKSLARWQLSQLLQFCRILESLHMLFQHTPTPGNPESHRPGARPPNYKEKNQKQNSSGFLGHPGSTSNSPTSENTTDERPRSPDVRSPQGTWAHIRPCVAARSMVLLLPATVGGLPGAIRGCLSPAWLRGTGWGPREQRTPRSPDSHTSETWVVEETQALVPASHLLFLGHRSRHRALLSQRPRPLALPKFKAVLDELNIRLL